MAATWWKHDGAVPMALHLKHIMINMNKIRGGDVPFGAQYRLTYIELPRFGTVDHSEDGQICNHLSRSQHGTKCR